MGPIFVDRLRLPCSASSALATEVQRYVPGSRAASPGAQQVLSHAKFGEVARIAAQPDFRMFHRTGGGALPVSVFGAYRKRTVSTEALVVVSPSFESSYLFQLFPDRGAYLDWWVDTIASKVVESSPNYLPPPVSLESLLYALHAVDSYRRVSYRSMLEYAPASNPFVAPREYAETMSRSLASSDLRWLLPAFVFLTPGLNQVNFDLNPENLGLLAALDFLIPTRHEQTGEPIYLFGEAGKNMGVEFYRSWMLSVGFDTAVVGPEGEQVMRRGFLAPTALANHLVMLEGSGGPCMVNHQALTAVELRSRLEPMLSAGLAVEPARVAAQAAPAAQVVDPVRAGGLPVGARTCPSCGAMVAAAGRFCPECGKEVPAAVVPGVCARCGAKLGPAARFCPDCGAPAG